MPFDYDLRLDNRQRVADERLDPGAHAALLAKRQQSCHGISDDHTQHTFGRDGFWALLSGVGNRATLDELDTYRGWVLRACVLYASCFSGKAATKIAFAG